MVSNIYKINERNTRVGIFILLSDLETSGVISLNFVIWLKLSVYKNQLLLCERLLTKM